MREGTEGSDAVANEESAVRRVAGRRGGSGGGTSAEESLGEWEEEFRVESLGM